MLIVPRFTAALDLPDLFPHPKRPGKSDFHTFLQALENMRYGTVNEPHAVATLVNYVIPTYFPELTFYEEG